MFVLGNSRPKTTLDSAARIRLSYSSGYGMCIIESQFFLSGFAIITTTSVQCGELGNNFLDLLLLRNLSLPNLHCKNRL